MSAIHPTESVAKPFSARQRVNRRIGRFTICVSVLSVLLTMLVWIVPMFSALERCRRIHKTALSEITCRDMFCDTSTFITDSYSEEPDYLIDLETRYAICVPWSSAEYAARHESLDYSDVDFIRRFREPAAYRTPDDEVWRLYSLQTNINGKTKEIFVGHRMKAPSKMVETLASQVGMVDDGLRRQAVSIAKSLANQELYHWAGPRPPLSVDGFQVVDEMTEKVVDWGEWLPIRLPTKAHIPNPGWQPLLDKGHFYIAQTDRDSTGRLSATSLADVGDLKSIGISCVIVFATTMIVARKLSRRFLWPYFATSGSDLPTLSHALHEGEGPYVEFKRGLSEDDAREGNAEEELLKSIAAFSNTDGGVIFVGVDDGGRAKGLRLDFKGRDRFRRKIENLVRNRIRPKPSLAVTFEESADSLIAKIVVGRATVCTCWVA
jgi:hypothetical protein